LDIIKAIINNSPCAEMMQLCTKPRGNLGFFLLENPSLQKKNKKLICVKKKKSRTVNQIMRKI
jgi:hypothetical protein